jgi:prepilin-type N-terminal cleavage/methylation domain-containing protein
MIRKGFTLLEVLLVMTLVSILLVIGLRSINIDKQFGDVNNAQRKSDVLTIYTAINQYRDDNAGNVPTGITDEVKQICQPNCSMSANKVDISTALEPYITFEKIPIDPKQQGLDITGYSVFVDNVSGRVIVSAPLAENGVIINTIE